MVSHIRPPCWRPTQGGCDLGDPSLPRQPDGSIARPPSGGLGCPACADNVNMRTPSHDGDPRHCR
eukprot:312602-Pyramimonas_sp.AAC.1